MKRIGEPWLRGKPYRDRPGVYALIVGTGGLLCVVQDGELQLPGGGIDPGEQPLQALHREVREETGWRIAEPVKITGFQRFAYLPDYGFWARKTQSIYLARAVRRHGPPTEEGHTPVWLPAEVAPFELDVAGDRWAAAIALDQGLI
ncbi:NUDIX domain-containing protein [Rhodobacteraceae bacterium NNCM2]|nr:NUDIX domain-containing protein [Coraliihabitans acroporae]